ncbi:MAG: hypothetical protein RR199_00085 [Alistipes sp.]
MKALLLLQGGFFLCALLLRAIAELVEGFSPIPELVEGSGARHSMIAKNKSRSFERLSPLKK